MDNVPWTRGQRRDFGPFAKAPVIPDDPVVSHDASGKVPAVRDRSMSYQPVGGVTAYQGGNGYRARERDPAHRN